MNYQKIGGFIKRKRKAMGLTQKELAQLAEVSPRTMQTIEKGNKVYLDTLKKVLNYLGYDIHVTNREKTEIIEF